MPLLLDFMNDSGPGYKFDRSTFQRPWAQLKYFTYQPAIYPRFIADVSPGARRGELVTVYDKQGEKFGVGFWNPGARVPLRMMSHKAEGFTEEHFKGVLERAVSLRTDLFNLSEETDAFRVVHSDGDGLSGLIVDKYADVLRVETHSYGVWSRLNEWLPVLHEALGTKRQIISVDRDIATIEAIPQRQMDNPANVKSVKIRENGVRYLVNFEEGHKTGFFCDQRENRKKLTKFTQGKSVLDLCCYTGGFSLSAKVTGGAEDVTGVDLDEKVIEQAKQNANLNQAKINWVHTDAFQYARQMQGLGRKWDVVVLDPPKLVFSREEEDDGGRRKYEDLNRLAMTLVAPGGIIVTCSCSGLLSSDEFETIVIKAAHRERKRLQFFDRTVAGPDHPVMSNCLESSYLKLLWARVW